MKQLYGRMRIWAASDPDYWIIGEDLFKGQANGLPFSSKSDYCIPKLDTSNWNFEEGLQNGPQMYSPVKVQGNDIKIRCIDCCTIVEVYYENSPVRMTTFTGEDIGRWYGYGKYTKESTVNGRWFYHSEWEWGRMGIWAASDPDYWIIGKDSVRGQSIGLAFSSKSDLCIPRDTSNWNFEAGLQNDAQIFKIQGNDIKIRCID